MVMLAVMVVALRVPYELTVTSVPENDSVEVPEESNAVPVTVTLPVNPCSSLVGEMLAGEGGGGVILAEPPDHKENRMFPVVPVCI